MSPPRGLYLLLGSDRARKRQRIHELEQALRVQPLDRHQLPGSSTDTDALLALARQQPAASPVRLIVVEDAARLGEKYVEALIEQAPRIAQTACIVLLVETELPARHPLTRHAAAMTVERWAVESTFAPKPFALTEALGRGDATAALLAVREQIAAGREPLEVIGLIGWQLNRWVLVKRWMGLGYSLERMASVSGWQPWQIQRVQTEVVRRPLPALQQLLHRCWQLDVDAKRGRALPQLAVEELVVVACLPSGASERESLV